ncbi:MAG: ornithine carbamoyltransferase [Candidatus Gottesmanbacteria bacterium]|nr:ornithine carbamoyltransferase [Candidatus Gottesmanbacteria bacterium]
MKTKHDFLSITDFTADEVLKVLTIATKLKKQVRRDGGNSPVFAGKTLIMIYEKPSLRTHASFEIGMTQLGGHALYFGPEHIGLGKREPVEHAAKVLSSMGDVIMARVFKHETVAELAKYSTVPVINGLSDLEHPCQILADLLTIQEHFGRLQGIRLAYVGDGENNVTHSLALAAGLLGMHISVGSPKGYTMKPDVVLHARMLAKRSGGSVTQTDNPKEAVHGAQVVYTDTWISMGDEVEKAKRLKIFPPYQINNKLMKLAKPEAIFMHDMPAYLGNEVTKMVFDSPHSVVYLQAENRLHAQKGLLVFLLTYEGKFHTGTW